MLAPEIIDLRQGVGAIKCRDGGADVEKHELRMDSRDGDVYMDGSCFGGWGHVRAAGLAVAQLVTAEDGSFAKWKLLQESISQMMNRGRPLMRNKKYSCGLPFW